MSFNNGGTDFDFLLTEDFLLFLDLCRDPNQVFKPNSNESCLAQTWLDKLCRYECKDLDERRLRNIYMSYLCCCLIEGVLKGPFASYPRTGPLQRVDFNPKQKQPLSCPPLIKVKSYKECEDTKNRYNDSCEQQLGICCCSQDDRFNDASVGVSGNGSGGSEVMRCCPEVRFSTDIQCKPEDATKRMSGHVFSEYMLREITSPGAYNTFKSSDSCQEYDPYGQVKVIMRQDVENLLQAIGAELRGNVGCGCNDYLESELLRYKNFIMNFSSIACALAKMESQPALRSFLLINLQNDLIKLLSDNCL